MNERYVVERDFEYKGFQCSVILQCMGHRCGYINVGHTSMRNKDYDDLDIWCHGGLTYSEDHLAGHEKKPNDWWIGWDYAHWQDANDYKAVEENFADNEEVMKMCKASKEFHLSLSFQGHVYTLDEVVSECKQVVDEILFILEKGGNND